jgi:hypothetical protein
MLPLVKSRMMIPSAAFGMPSPVFHNIEKILNREQFIFWKIV